MSNLTVRIFSEKCPLGEKFVVDLFFRGLAMSDLSSGGKFPRGGAVCSMFVALLNPSDVQRNFRKVKNISCYFLWHRLY